MKCFGKTDKGLIRNENQDYFKCMEFSDVMVCVVCDGMGGLSYGALASEIAAESFCSKFYELSQEYLNNPLAYSLSINNIIKKSVEFSNTYLYNKSIELNCRGDMGTTLVCAVVYNNTLYSVNVGDSRLYEIQDNNVLQITKDHTYVQLLLDMKMISEDEAEKYDNNAITRGIGLDESIDIDTYVIEINENTVYLLCSDGLYKMINNDDIGMVSDMIKNNTDISYMTDVLINKAIVGGGMDNITAVLIAQ